MKGIRLVEICKNLRDITSPNFPTSLINHKGCSLKATDVLMLSGFWRKPPLLPPSASLLLEAELIAHAVSRFQSTLHPPSLPLVSVIIVGLSYGARNVLSYTRGMMQNFLEFRDSPLIPLRRWPPTLLVELMVFFCGRPGSGCQLLHSMRLSDNQFGGGGQKRFWHSLQSPQSLSPLLFLLVLPSPAEFWLHCTITMIMYLF